MAIEVRMIGIFIIFFLVRNMQGYDGNYYEELSEIALKVNGLGLSWQAENNFSQNITISSIEKLMGFKKPEPRVTLSDYTYHNDILDSEIPQEFDARINWPNCPSIGQIVDQGNCGSCWAIGVVSAFSDRLCIGSEGRFSLPISPNELISCCLECGDCTGGYSDRAWDYLVQYGGVTGGPWGSNIGCQPYAMRTCDHFSTKGALPPCGKLPEEPTICTKTCTNPNYKIPFEEDRIRAFQAYQIDGDKVTEIQKEIMTNGPVTAAMDIMEDFIVYKKGVFSHSGLGRRLGGHTLKLIGWGSDPKEGVPYWLAVNSWGPAWGDQGFVKIKRGNDECLIESYVYAAQPDLSNILN